MRSIATLAWTPHRERDRDAFIEFSELSVEQKHQTQVREDPRGFSAFRRVFPFERLYLACEIAAGSLIAYRAWRREYVADSRCSSQTGYVVRGGLPEQFGRVGRVLNEIQWASRNA